MMGEKPFTECPMCGTPKLKGHALVLYFPTREDLDEFVVVFKEAKPNAQAYPVTSPESDTEG